MLRIRNAKNIEGKTVDLMIEGSRIAKVTETGNSAIEGSRSPGSSTEEGMPSENMPEEAVVIDASGYVLLPPFVDAHTHPDKTMIGMDWFENVLPPYLPAWVENERNSRRAAGIDPYRQACRLFERDLSFGTIGIRAHVDIDTVHGLTLLEGVLKAREEYNDRLKIEIVAFPQSGLLVRPGTYELMREALLMGADLVGGIDPANIDRDPAGGVDAIFRLAESTDKPVDIHLHESGHLGAFTIGLIAERTKASGMDGRVTISHAFCLGYPEPGLAEPLIEKLAETGISVTTGGQAYIKYVPSVTSLLDAGVLIAGGNDNVRDMWSPFGSGDMLERAMLIAMRNGLRRDDLLRKVLTVCTENGAKLLHLPDYGTTAGRDASFVLVKAQNAAECAAQVPKERIVFNHGKKL